MRGSVILLLVFTLLITSCETDNQKQNTEELESNFTFKSITNSKIGYEKEGKLELYASKNAIMDKFKDLVSEAGLGLKPKSFKIVTIDNKKYLRFYSEGDSVSTIALILDDSDNQYRTGSTVCTTSACSSGGGCIPNGQYCTKCKPFGPDGPSGDCDRTTTIDN